MSLRGWEVKACRTNLKGGAPSTPWLLLQVFNSLLSGRLLGLGVGAMGQPVSYPPDCISDPVSHFVHVHGDLPGSSTSCASKTTLD
jgi:hypothetical protein